jgi:hypothetical protein
VEKKEKDLQADLKEEMTAEVATTAEAEAEVVIVVAEAVVEEDNRTQKQTKQTTINSRKLK